MKNINKILFLVVILNAVFLNFNIKETEDNELSLTYFVNQASAVWGESSLADISSCQIIKYTTTNITPGHWVEDYTFSCGTGSDECITGTEHQSIMGGVQISTTINLNNSRCL